MSEPNNVLEQPSTQMEFNMGSMITGDLGDKLRPDPEQLLVVSNNLSPLPNAGEKGDQVYFPLENTLELLPYQSDKKFFRLRGSRQINWLARSALIKPFAARCTITLIPNVPGGTAGQQITYVLILKATYSNTWAELAKIYNKIWNDTDYIVAEYDPERTSDWRKYRGIRPYPEISKDEIRHLWRHQILYMRDHDSVQAVLESLKSRTDLQCRRPDYDGTIMGWNVGFDRLMEDVEAAALDAGVELKEAGDPMAGTVGNVQLPGFKKVLEDLELENRKTDEGVQRLHDLGFYDSKNMKSWSEWRELIRQRDAEDSSTCNRT